MSAAAAIDGVGYRRLLPLSPGAGARVWSPSTSAIIVRSELEASLISRRIKAALAGAKRRGKTLGGFRGYVGDTKRATEAHRITAAARTADLGPIIRPLRQARPSGPDRRGN